MTHQEKVEYLIEELGHQGEGAYTVAPPLFRMLWRIGREVPPPFFIGFGKLSFLMGTFFGVLWAVLFNVFMGVWVWWQAGLDLAGLVGALVGAMLLVPLSAVIAGVPFGLIMAWYYRWRAQRLGLASSWEDYPRSSSS